MLMARANFRRAKGQTAAIALLVLLAAFMLNLWLMLATDYKQNFDRYHDKLNGEHVTLVMNDDREEVREFLAETLGEDDRVTEYCMDDAFFMVGSFVYHQGEVNTELVILEKETALNRPIGTVEIVEDGGPESGVYLPMLYGSDGRIRTGETIALTIGNRTRDYQVCGFLNSVMAGSHNCSMSVVMFTEDR